MRNPSLFAALLLVAACGDAGTATRPTPVPVATGDGAAPVPAPTFADLLRAPERYGRVEDQVDDVALAAATSAIRYRARFVPGFPGLVEFVLNNTGSGWQEKFLLQMPPTPPTSPAPLLVVFHKFGSSHGDVLNTSFLAETQARGWYCLAPLGARQKHFGNLESQINTRAALRLAAHLFPIDRDRVYGVGFSMGGGAVANYAAGHLDPTDLQFAAIANHTGGVSLPHTWFHEPDDADLDDDMPSPGQNLEVPDVLEDLYGGPPSAVPFAYLRCSVIDVDPISGTASTQNDMARNLSTIPTYTTIANADPQAYLGTQTYALDGVLQAQAAGHQLSILNGNVHAWTTLDEAAVCDWMQTKTLQAPLSARTLATENGRWHHFDVEQVAAGAFTPFTWSVDVPTRRVQISQTANLQRISIHAADLGLPTSGAFTLVLSTSDGSGDRARILGVNGAPTLVTRDGIPASATYDSLTQSVEVVETDPLRHEWLLVLP